MNGDTPETADVRRGGWFVRWWLDGDARVRGLWRLFFYGVLFVWAFKDLKSPLSGLGFYALTDPVAFRPYGLLAWLGVPYVEPETLRWVVWVTAAAWVCAAVGLWFRVTSVLTAAGALFLHGMFHGSNALNHYWFLPVYAMAALCFAGTGDRWSVDWHVRRWRGRAAAVTLADTGFARRLMLVFAVGFYFAAGVSKLRTSGLAWADGHTVHYFALTRGDMYPLSTLLGEHLWLCTLLGAGSLALEVGAPLALVSRWARPVFLLGWAGMHLGIRWSMGPAYYANLVVLLVLVDWGTVAQVAKAAARPFGTAARAAVERTTARWLAVGRSGVAVGVRRGHAAAALGTAVAAVLVATAVRGWSWWPVTDVYMYSGYFSAPHDVRSGYARGDYDTEDAVRRIARDYVADRPNVEATEYFRYRVVLRLTGGGTAPRYVFEGLGVASWKQWVLTVAGPVAIRELADAEGPAYEGVASSAEAFLRGYVPVLQRHLPEERWRGYERVELVYVLGGPVADGGESGPGSAADELAEFWRFCDVEITPGSGDGVIVLASVALR